MFPFKVTKPIKDYLEKEETKLKQRNAELEKEDPFIDTDRLMDNAAIDTEAAEEAGHERVSALRRETDKMLVRIRKTLTRIKVGKYGLCIGCKKMIDTDRLAIDPTIEYCINCAKKNDAKKP